MVCRDGGVVENCRRDRIVGARANRVKDIVGFVCGLRDGGWIIVYRLGTGSAGMTWVGDDGDDARL